MTAREKEEKRLEKIRLKKEAKMTKEFNKMDKLIEVKPNVR